MLAQLCRHRLASGPLRPCATSVRALGRGCSPLGRVCQRRLQSTAAAEGSAAAEGKSWLLRWCESNPIKLGVGVAAVKTWAADLLTQTALEGKAWAEIDWRRNAVFAVFGFAYMGCAQYYLYVNCFSRWFAGAAKFVEQPLSAKLTDFVGQRAVLKQVLFDLLIHPQWVFPIYYIIKEAVCGTPGTEADSPKATAAAALKKYWKNNFDPTNEAGLLTDWIAFWKIWVVGDIIVFGFCPMWARLPINHIFSFVYMCVLSFMRGASAPEDAPREKH